MQQPDSQQPVSWLADPRNFGHYRLIADDDGQPLVADRTEEEIVLLGFDHRWQRLVELHLLAGSSYLGSRQAAAFFDRARSAGELRGHGFPRVVDYGRCQGWLFWACQVTDGERFADFVHRRGQVEPMLLVVLADRVVRLLQRLRQFPEMYQRVDLEGLMLVSWQEAYAVPRLWRPGITAPDGWQPPPVGFDPVTHQFAHWLSFLASGRYWQPEDLKPSGLGRRQQMPDLPPALRGLWRRTIDRQHGGVVPTLDDWARELGTAARGLVRRAGLKQIGDSLPAEKLGFEEPAIQQWLLPGEDDVGKVTGDRFVALNGRRPGVPWHVLRVNQPAGGGERLLQRLPPPTVVPGLNREASGVAKLGPLTPVCPPEREIAATGVKEANGGNGGNGGTSPARPRKPPVIGSRHGAGTGGDPVGPASVPPAPTGPPPVLLVHDVWDTGSGVWIHEAKPPGLSLMRVLAARKRLRIEEVVPVIDRLKLACDLVNGMVPWALRVRPPDIFLHVAGDPPERVRQELTERHIDAWPEFEVHLRLHLTLATMLDTGLVPSAAPYVSAEERHRVEWVQLVATMLAGLEPDDSLEEILERLPKDVRNWIRCLELGGPAPDVEELIEGLKRPDAVEPLQVIGRAG